MGRILEISESKLLISTDLQGNWDDYLKVRGRFEEARLKGQADILVLDGDLPHAPENALYQDKSLEILDHLIDNPDSRVITLLGNHELMQIYHMGQVSRGNQFFVEPLEELIEKRGCDRERYVGFMKNMPFGIVTHSGITITHTGANPPMAGIVVEREGRPSYRRIVENNDGYTPMDTFDHEHILSQLKKITRELMERQHGKLADDFFDDYSPQIGKVFGRTAIGSYLWDVFFNRNEREFGNERYSLILDEFLKTMSRKIPQNLVIAGHVAAPDGYQIVCNRQLRISTSDGATSDDVKVLAVVNSQPDVYSPIPEVAIQQLVGSLKYLY